MKTLNERGAINVLLIPLILTVLLLFGAMGFGYWAFAQRQDYKNNSDQKVAAAVSAAEERTQAADAKQYAEEAKKPLKRYVGPSAFGAVTVDYPKTWSAYVIEPSSNDSNLNGFFQPDFVPNTSETKNSYAMRFQLVQQSYDQVLSQYSSLVQLKTGTISPYSLPKVPNIIGARIDGQIAPNKEGVVIVLPLRNMTLKIWTESKSFSPDFNNIILPNMTFSP